MDRIKRTIRKYKDRYDQYNTIANISEIARRYFVMNSFDGILTILGILMGGYFAGIKEPGVMITTSLGASIAISVSGVWGTYLTEEAERKNSMRELEKATLNKLTNTTIDKASKAAILILSIINGMSPFVAMLVVLLPFFLGNIIGISTMYLSSIVIAFVLLIFLGGFLGHISKENMAINSMKMVVAGVVSIILIFFLEVAR
jgi:predicted membrane protein (TIGR00267 family)